MNDTIAINIDENKSNIENIEVKWIPIKDNFCKSLCVIITQFICMLGCIAGFALLLSFISNL